MPSVQWGQLSPLSCTVCCSVLAGAMRPICRCCVQANTQKQRCPISLSVKEQLGLQLGRKLRKYPIGCALAFDLPSLNGHPYVVSPGYWPTSSTVSSCGVAALSSESFCEPASALLRTSLLFLCLCASFFTCPSALPLLSRRTGLVSHLRRVLPGRLGPGELWAPIM